MSSGKTNRLGQERFIPGEAGLGERGQLVAQVSLEFLRVGTMNSLPAA